MPYPSAASRRRRGRRARAQSRSDGPPAASWLLAGTADEELKAGPARKGEGAARDRRQQQAVETRAGEESATGGARATRTELFAGSAALEAGLFVGRHGGGGERAQRPI